MPWLKVVLQCLPKIMEKDRSLKTLTFISCVGLIHNGDFVSFRPLHVLLGEMTITQDELQRYVRRMHDSVPHKMPPCQPKPMAKPTPQEPPRQSPSPQESETDLQEEAIEQIVQRVETKTVSANISTQWSEEEVQFVLAHPDMSHAQAYWMYLQRCEELRRPARTFRAFQSKRSHGPCLSTALCSTALCWNLLLWPPFISPLASKEINAQLTKKRLCQKYRMQTRHGYNSKGMVKEVSCESRSFIFLSGEKEYRINCRHLLSVKEPMPSQYDGNQVIHAPTKVNDPIPKIPDVPTRISIGQITSQTRTIENRSLYDMVWTYCSP